MTDLSPLKEARVNDPAPTIDRVDEPEGAEATVMEAHDLDVYYGEFRAVRDVDLDIRANEITAMIGLGGMGAVYRGRQPKLNRDVAIKILPAEITDDEETDSAFNFAERFQRRRLREKRPARREDLQAVRR